MAIDYNTPPKCPKCHKMHWVPQGCERDALGPSDATPCSALFGHLPLDGRVAALRDAWTGAAKSLKRVGRLAEAQRLEMCVEEIGMILPQNASVEARQ